jgi:hypothetical protein
MINNKLLTDLNPSVCIVAKTPLKHYFASSPQCNKMEFIMDYLRRWNIPCYTTAKLYKQIKDSFPHAHIDDISFVNSMFIDGGTITGTSSFPIEEKDLLFLAGNLAIRGYKRILVIVKDKTFFAEPKKVMQDHNDIFKSLIDIGWHGMICTFDNPDGFIGLIKYIDPAYYNQNPV